jgi:hypothetical protein
MRIMLVVLVALAGCGDDGGAADFGADLSASPADMSAVRDLSIYSTCGHPGDPGNSIGVGKFCVVQGDCSTSGTVCAHPFSPDDYFCTLPCSPGNPATCGENANCVCQNNQCGCLPAACGGLPQG